jgi:hypothetical protein
MKLRHRHDARRKQNEEWAEDALLLVGLALAVGGQKIARLERNIGHLQSECSGFMLLLSGGIAPRRRNHGLRRDGAATMGRAGNLVMQDALHLSINPLHVTQAPP